MLKRVMKLIFLPVFLFAVVWLIANNSAVSGRKGTDHRIVGGRFAETGERPFQVSIQRSYNDLHFCGGSIVSPNHVLTAAHCVHYKWGGVLPPYLVNIVAGQLSLKKTNGSFWTEAEEIYVHEDYDAESLANDIAIIELLKTIPENNGLIRPIALNRVHQEAGTLCTVSGWGVNEYSSEEVSPWLLVAEVKLIRKDICNERYSKVDVVLNDSVVCAANEDVPADSCQGDSGGPLVCMDVLVGVVSTGKGCGDARFPGIYTDVHYYHQWIEDIISQFNSSTESTTASFESFTTATEALSSGSSPGIGEKYSSLFLTKPPAAYSTASETKSSTFRSISQSTTASMDNDYSSSSKHGYFSSPVRTTISTESTHSAISSSFSPSRVSSNISSTILPEVTNSITNEFSIPSITSAAPSPNPSTILTSQLFSETYNFSTVYPLVTPCKPPDNSTEGNPECQKNHSAAGSLFSGRCCLLCVMFSVLYRKTL